MAVPEQTPYSEHTGNGVTKSFALGFICESKDHLIVLVDEIEPPIATWSLSGGNVVFTTAPVSGSKVTIQRNTPFSRTVDYQSYNNSFRPQSVNGDFDRLWLKLQELGVADWLMKLYVDRLHQQQEVKIKDLKDYVDDRDDELRSYLMEEIRKQGVALDQLDDYYNYLMQRLAQIAVDKGWAADFVVDGPQTQKEINLYGGKKYNMPFGGYPAGSKVLLENGGTVESTTEGNTNDPNVNMTGWESEYSIIAFTAPEYFGGNIQKALDRGGVVVLTKNYVVSATLNLNVPNTVVWLRKGASVKITAQQSVFKINADNCKILEGEIEGFGSASSVYSTGAGIVLNGVKGCEISYTKISKTGGAPILLLATSTNKSCVDNVIAYNDIDCTLPTKRGFDTGAIMMGYTNEQSNNYSHDHNHIYANNVDGGWVVDHGASLIGWGKRNTFSQNKIVNCLEYGIVVYQSPYVDNKLFDNIVTGNFIDGVGHITDNLSFKGMGIYLQKSDSSIVSNNIVRNTIKGNNGDDGLARAAIAINGCNSTVVDSNIIVNSARYGIQLAQCFDCKATNNSLDNVVEDGIRITHSSKLKVTGNSGRRIGRYGVFVYSADRTTGRADTNGPSGDNIDILFNDIESTSEGIWSNSLNLSNAFKYGSIIGNTIKSPAISIYIDNSVSANISGNKCRSDTNLARIQLVLSDKASVTNNIVESTASQDSGRIVLLTATNPTVSGNKFSPSNSTTPIQINGHGFKAEKSRYYSTSAPSAGSYEAGDVVWNTSPVLGGVIGWVCVTAGSPGAWVGFGVVGDTQASLTTTALQAATNAINTVGKFGGKEIFNQTDSKKYYAEGSAPTARWMRFDGASSITPA